MRDYYMFMNNQARNRAFEVIKRSIQVKNLFLPELKAKFQAN